MEKIKVRFGVPRSLGEVGNIFFVPRNVWKKPDIGIIKSIEDDIIDCGEFRVNEVDGFLLGLLKDPVPTKGLKDTILTTIPLALLGWCIKEGLLGNSEYFYITVENNNIVGWER